MAFAVRDRPSPNHGARRTGPVDILLVHYTGMPSAAEALDRLCDPAAEVSAHWLIEEDGTLWRLVAEDRRAWHAGLSCWAGEGDVNSRSVGIELQNPGHEWGYRPFPEAQMAALEELARDILARHPIPPHRVLGHSDVAPARKEDPGELFDWPRLARRGIGLWPFDGSGGEAAGPAEAAAFHAALSRFGYDTSDPAAATAAFQRHFRPARIDGAPDAECLARVLLLLAAAPPD